MTLPMLDIMNVTTGVYQPPNTNNVAEGKARETAQDFEAFFISQFIEALTASIPTDGPFGGGQGEKIFRSMLSQEYAKSMSQTSDIGIADAVYREIIKIQEGATT